MALWEIAFIEWKASQSWQSQQFERIIWLARPLETWLCCEWLLTNWSITTSRISSSKIIDDICIGTNLFFFINVSTELAERCRATLFLKKYYDYKWMGSKMTVSFVFFFCFFKSLCKSSDASKKVCELIIYHYVVGITRHLYFFSDQEPLQMPVWGKKV